MIPKKIGFKLNSFAKFYINLPAIVIFMLGFGVGNSYSQSPCPSISFTLTNFNTCCYTVQLDNGSECTPQLTLLLDFGQFTNWTVDVANGFTGTLINANEILITHSSGIIPFGVSTPIEFCNENADPLEITMLYDFVCGMPENCFAEFPIVTCSSQDPCTVNFEYSIESNCGLFQFISFVTGTPPITYSWNFGDPGSGSANTSTLPNPTHQFSDLCEDYTICLDITTEDGCTASLCNDIVVLELDPPVITCPPDVVVNCDSDILPSITGFATAVDNCEADPSISYSDEEIGSFPCDYLIQRTWSAEDQCGHVSTCIQIIAVIDNVPPVITCPASVVVTATTPGPCTKVVTGLQWLSATDNCGTPTVTYNITGATIVNGNNDVSGLTFNQGVSTVTYVATDECENTSTCSFTVEVKCEDPFFCPCPNGGNSGPNLVINGDFSAGNTGFTNDFIFFTPGTNTNNGSYSVLTGPQVPVANSQWGNIGHTTGTSTDKFLVVDGLSPNGVIAWQQTIPGTATGLFNICLWANNLVIPTRNYFDPIVQVFVNGVAITPIITLPESPNQWIPINGSWTGTLPATIEVLTFSTENTGNDLAIDDIRFSQCLITDTCTADFIVQSNSLCGLVNITNTSTNVGSSPTWSWEVDGNQVATTQNLSWQFITPGTHLVCLIVNGGQCEICRQIFVEIPSPTIICPPDTCLFVNPGVSGISVNYPPPVVTNNGCQLTTICTPASGFFFPLGSTQVICSTYVAGGVWDTCMFNVMVKTDSMPSFAPVSPLCENDPPLLLNSYATPAGGTFAGTGVNCGAGLCTFDPVSAGSGIHTITYTYTNSFNHTFTTFANIQVTPIIECDSNCCLLNEVYIQQLTDDPCCFNISIENYCPQEFAGVCLQGLQGVQFASASANIGWVKYDFGSSKILFDSPGAWIPTGNVQNMGVVCIDNSSATNSPQQIEVIFVDNAYEPTDCRKIIETYCPLIPTDTTCLLAVNDTIICNLDGTYTYTFYLENHSNPSFTINYVELHTDPGFQVTPSTFSVAGLDPNDPPAGPFTTTLSGTGAVAFANFCIWLTAHDSNITTDPPTNCCTDTTRFCVTLPYCCECEENLSTTVLPKGNGATDCCYQLEINNAYFCNPLLSVEVTMLTAGVTFGPITPQSGWYYVLGAGNTNLLFKKFPPGNVPLGISQLPVFCLNAYQSTQYIEVKYHFLVNGVDTVLCRKTLVLNCPPEPACDSLLNPQLTCLPNGDYQFSFQVYNNSGQTINTVTLLPTTPGVLPILPISIPPLINNSTSGVITVIIPQAQLYGNPTFCLKLKISFVANGIEEFCCTNPIEVCIPVPVCPCECGDWQVNSFTIGGVQQMGNPCGGTYNVILGQQVVLNQLFNCLGPDCDVTYLWEQFEAPYAIPVASWSSTSGELNSVFNRPGTYCFKVTPICNGKKCEPCFVCFNVIEPVCACGSWETLNLVKPEPLSGTISPLTCGGTINLGCNQLFSISGNYNCTGTQGYCNAKYQYTITGPGVNVNSPISNTLSVPLGFSQSGTYTLTINVHCGGVICPCVFTIVVACPADCTCPGVNSLQINQGNQTFRPLCNSSAVTIACPVSDLNISGVFPCNGPCKIPLNTTWTLMHVPTGATSTSTFTVSPAFNILLPTTLISAPGEYMLTITGNCGTQACSCKIRFIVPTCPASDCKCANNLVRNPGFFLGAVPGNDMPPGQSQFWQGHSNTPQVTNNDQHCDPTSIQMWGRRDDGEAIRQGGFSFQQGKYYQISFCARYVPISYLPTTYVQFNFCAANSALANPFTGVGCTGMGLSANITNQSWVTYTLPIWLAPNNFNTLIINAQNANTSGNNVHSFGRIDNICIREVENPDCPNSLIQNGKFEMGSPNGADQGICLATNWCSIWTGASTGDFWNTGAQNPIQGLLTPMPVSQNNFAGFWNRYLPGERFYREGILNRLSAPISPNTGCYNITMKMACLTAVSGIPRMSIYGVPTGSNSTVTSGGPGAVLPLNPDLFLPDAILLGTYLVPNNCNKNFQPISPVIQFNSNALNVPIDRIFLTRADGPGGGAYLAVDDICLEPAPCNMESCECGSLDWADFYQEWGFQSALSCNNAPLPVPCVKRGQNYFIHGDFKCLQDFCGTNNVNWILDRPGALTDISGSTSTAQYPHFDVSMPWTHFTQPGLYSLQITRLCGSKPCSCTFNFEVPSCDCSCDELEIDVAKGFLTSSNQISCNRILRPVALCPTDIVTWSVNGPGLNQNYGPTTGNNTILIQPPSPGGIYSVCMIVSRIDPNTGQECPREYCQDLIINCGSMPNDTFHQITPCPGGDRINNGDFTLGLMTGHLGETGTSQNWDLFPNGGDGLIYVDSSGASDGGHIIFIGGKDNFAGIVQEVDLKGNVAYIGFNIYNYLGTELPQGTALEFRLQDEPYPGSPGQVIYRHNLESDFEGWGQVSISIPQSFLPVRRFLVICLQNENEDVRSIVGIDNIEFCTNELVGIRPVEELQNIRIYPNPNSGTFSVDFSKPAVIGATIRIVGLAGQVVWEKRIENNNQLQSVDDTNLPDGMYFIQIVSGYRILSVNKFVKL